MRLFKKYSARFGSLMLACALACMMVPTMALATGGDGTDASSTAQQGELGSAALQPAPELGTDLPGAKLPDVADPLQQDSAAPVQDTPGQASSAHTMGPQAEKAVTIDGPDEVAVPNSMKQQVLVDGAAVTEDDYTFEWYGQVVSSGEIVWQRLANSRGVELTGSTFSVAAVSLQALDKKGYYYCQVTEKSSGKPLNPIIASGDDISDPMKEVTYFEDKTCAIIATKDDTIVVEPGQSKSGLSISADGTKITMDNMTVDGSENSEGWNSDAVQLIVPRKTDGSSLDVSVDVRGTNTLTCKFPSLSGLNWGFGLFAELEGNHEVTFASSSGDGKIVSNGGVMGCFLGGSSEKGTVNYHLDGGLEMECKNDQNAPTKTGAGALVLSEAGLTVENASLTLNSNGTAGLGGFYGAEDAPRIAFGKDSKVRVAMVEQNFESESHAATAGIGVSGGNAGSLVIDGAQVEVSTTGIKDPAALGIALPGEMEIRGGSSVTVTFDEEHGAASSVYQGLESSTMKIIEQSTVAVKTKGVSGSSEGGIMGLRVIGQLTTNSEGEFVTTVLPKLEILDGSTVSIDVAAEGQASGIYVYSQDDSKGPATPFGSFVVRDSDVSVDVAAKKQAFGIETHSLDVSESANHTVSSTVQGGTLNCAVLAVKGVSIAREDYTPGYKSTLWTLAENTAILAPVPNEINLFSVQYENIGGYEPGETVFDPADTSKPAASVVIGKRGPIVVDPAGNHIDGIAEGSRIMKGATMSFAAAGAGMGNVSPLAGDTRFVPVSWKVNPQGVWTAAPYSASFATKDMKVGSHTLAITFDKETFDGTTWVKMGSTDEKRVTFELYEQKLAPTGDSPTGAGLVLVVLASACALVLARSHKKEASL